PSRRGECRSARRFDGSGRALDRPTPARAETVTTVGPEDTKRENLMTYLRTAAIALLVFAISASAFAGDLQDSIAKAAQQQQQEERAPTRGTNKPLVWTGAALFVGGMAL